GWGACGFRGEFPRQRKGGAVGTKNRIFIYQFGERQDELGRRNAQQVFWPGAGRSKPKMGRTVIPYQSNRRHRTREGYFLFHALPFVPLAGFKERRQRRLY